MKASAWRKRIVQACEAAGTYKECFDSVIDTLALILERRDDADDEYKKGGGSPLVRYTNKGGATNDTKNPALVLWDDLNKSALAYWRDLGLTPAGLKRINENAVAPKRKSVLAEALKDLDKGL